MLSARTRYLRKDPSSSKFFNKIIIKAIRLSTMSLLMIIQLIHLVPLLWFNQLCLNVKQKYQHNNFIIILVSLISGLTLGIIQVI